MARNNFARTASGLSSYELPDHKELETGDELTTISINKEFRSLISTLVLDALKGKERNDEWLNNEDKIINFLIDLYDKDSFLYTRIYDVALASNVVVSSLTPANIVEFEQVHNFTRKNALVECFFVVQGGSGPVDYIFNVSASSLMPSESAAAVGGGANPTTLVATANFTDISPGEQTLRLSGSVDTPNGQILSRFTAFWRVWDYD